MIAQQSETPSREGYGRRQRVGLVLGPALLGLVCVLPTPAGLSPQAKNLVALIALMAVWWMTVFFLSVAAWGLRAALVIGPLAIPGWSTWLGLEVHDGTIAVAAVLLLFLIPIDLQRGQFVLDWASAVRIPWDVLFLCGGGFALATGFGVMGLAEWLPRRNGEIFGASMPCVAV